MEWAIGIAQRKLGPGRVREAARALVLVAALLAGGAAFTEVGPALATVPEPEPVPRRWELDFRPGPMRVMSVEVEGQGAHAYLYMTYRVANNSSEDVLFAPIFELATSDGQILRSGREVPAEVTRAILHKLDSPLMMDQISILGTLQQGEANAREGVVVWPLPAVSMDTSNLYVAGLSGETKVVDAVDHKTKELKRVTIRKTRMMRFRFPGEVLSQGSEPFPVVEDRWILR